MKSGKQLPSIARLREALSYDPETGYFVWVAPSPKATRVKRGDRAGCFDGRYVYITLDGIRFAAHRAAIAITEGAWPSAHTVDHRNGVGEANRRDNLREASRGVNQQNQRRAHRTNSTGLLGVVPVPLRRSPKKFRSQIWVDGAAKNLGYYVTAQEAHDSLHEGCTL